MNHIDHNGIRGSDLIHITKAQLAPSGALASNQIEPFNQFISDYPSFLATRFNNDGYRVVVTQSNKGIAVVEYGFGFSNVSFIPPYKSTDFATSQISAYPFDAMKTGDTYSAKIITDVNVKYRFIMKDSNGKEVPQPWVNVTLEKRYIGYIPIMVGSKLCNLSKIMPSQYPKHGSDIDEKGGYFIVEGTPRFLLPKFSITKNMPTTTIVKNKNVQTQFISQMGSAFDTSRHCAFQYHEKSGRIIVTIYLSKDLNLIMPFYALFYLLGATSDEEIFNIIIPDYDEANERHQRKAGIFQNAMAANYAEVVSTFNKKYAQDLTPFTGNIRGPNEIQLVISRAINTYDPAANAYEYKFDTPEDRLKSIKHTTELINKRYLINIGVETSDNPIKMEYTAKLINNNWDVILGTHPDDKNHITRNSIDDASTSIKKLTKSIFNLMVVQEIRKGLKNQFEKNPEALNVKSVVEAVLSKPSLGDTYKRAFKNSGDNKISVRGGSTINVRAIFQTFEHGTPHGWNKQINSVTLDPTNSPGAVSTAMLKYRDSNNTKTRCECGTFCQEGPDVGIKRLLVATVKFTRVISAVSMKDYLNKNIDPISRDTMEYPKIYVNGSMHGAHKEPYKLVRQLRVLKRSRKSGITDIDKISIIYEAHDKGNVHINTNIGRMYYYNIIVYRLPYSSSEDDQTPYPLLPLDRNTGLEIKNRKDLSAYDKKCIDQGQVQWTRLQPKHIIGLSKGTLRIRDLVNEGVLEICCADECTNIMCADSISTFDINCKDHLNVFTHITLPWELLCLGVMQTPFGSCIQQVRVAYNAKFPKQSFQVMMKNFDNIISPHNIYLNNFSPAARSDISDGQIQPSAIPVIESTVPNRYNQEDSTIVSCHAQSKFEAITVGIITVKCDDKQSIQKPVKKNRDGIDHNSHILESGFPKIGAEIWPGKPYIGKVETNRIGEGENIEIRKRDISPTNSTNLMSTILRVYEERVDLTCEKVIKIAYYQFHPARPGSKTATRGGCKAVISKVSDYLYMPYSEEGVISEFCLNISSFITRMEVGQIYAKVGGTITMMNGLACDGTFFKSYDFDEMDKLSEGTEIDKNCLTNVMGGIIGNRFNRPSSFGVCDIQALDKLGPKQSSTTTISYRNPRTGQIQKSTKNNGGSKNGILEHNSLYTHGANAVFKDIMYRASDGGHITYCKTCKFIATTSMDKTDGVFRCLNSKCPNPEFVRTYGVFATSYIANLQETLGIGVQFITREPEFTNLMLNTE